MVGSANTHSSLSPEWVEAVKTSGRFARYRWEKRQTVAITTLDALIKEHGRPDFAKIDVEGFEYQVVAGLSVPIPALSLEFSPEYTAGTFKCIEHLCALGQVSFNYSIGETMKLALDRWTTADDIRGIIGGFRNDFQTFGDIYARFGA